MEKKEKTNENPAANLAWQMFQKTGEAGYYMLYKNLNNLDKNTDNDSLLS